MDVEQMSNLGPSRLGMGCVRVAGSCLELCWGAAAARRRVVGAEGGAGSQKVPEFLFCSPEFPKV